MAGGEDQSQQFIAEVVVQGGLEVFDASIAFILEVAADLVVLLRQHLVAAEPIDGPALGRGHQPGAGIVRDAGLRPFGERGDERVLRQLFGEAHVAHHAGEARDEPGLFDAEDRFDRVMGFGRSPHVPLKRAKRAKASHSGDAASRAPVSIVVLQRSLILSRTRSWISVASGVIIPSKSAIS